MRSILLRGGAIALAALFCLTNAATANVIQEDDAASAGGADVRLLPAVLFISACPDDSEFVNDATLGAGCSDSIVLPGGAAVPLTPEACASLDDLIAAEARLAASTSVHVAAPGLAGGQGGCAAPRYVWAQLYQHSGYSTSGWRLEISGNVKCSEFPQGAHFGGVSDIRALGTRYDNEISSAFAMPGFGCSVKLFQHPSYTGSAALCAPGCQDLRDSRIAYPASGNMNDRTTSFWFEFQPY